MNLTLDLKTQNRHRPTCLSLCERVGAIGSAGGVSVTEPGRASGLGVALSEALAGVVCRAQIVLLAAVDVANQHIAAVVGVSVPTALTWRGRHHRQGLAGLGDTPRPGRPRTIDHRAIVTATLTPPPKRLGVTHRSSRLPAAGCRPPG